MSGKKVSGRYKKLRRTLKFKGILPKYILVKIAVVAHAHATLLRLA